MQEAQETNFESRDQAENIVRFAVVKTLIEKPKLFIDKILSNEEIKDSMKEMTNINIRFCALSVLALAEFIPFLEKGSDATKSMKILKSIGEKVKNAKDKGVFKKTFDLYPNVPNWAMKTGLVLDVGADVLPPPFSTVAGILPELWQIMMDKYNLVASGVKTIKELAEIAKEVYFCKSEFTQKQVSDAKLAFK